MSSYIPPVPTVGDIRYNNLLSKKLIDILRTFHYDIFKKDLSINENFGIITEFSYTSTSCGILTVRGITPFKLKFGIEFLESLQNPNGFIEFKCSPTVFHGDLQVPFSEYINKCINEITTNDFNIIYTHDYNKELNICHIPFGLYCSKYNDALKGNYFYQWVEEMCADNLWDFPYIDLVALEKSMSKKSIDKILNILFENQIEFWEYDNEEPKQMIKVDTEHKLIKTLF